MITRRQLIEGTAAVVCAGPSISIRGGVAYAQISPKTFRVGRLSLGSGDSRPARASSDAIFVGLHELGYVEGRDFVVERRDAAGQAEQLPKLAAELVRLSVDVLLVTGVTATRAALNATGTIPIVCMMGDPVGQRFVKSLARPGGNVTGVTLNSGGTDLGGKFLQLLHEVSPRLTRVGFLRSAHNPATTPAAFFPAESLAAIELVTAEIRNAAGLGDAFERLLRAKIEALTNDGDPLTDAEFVRIVGFAMKHRLPGIYPRREFADEGGLMTYGPNVYETWKQAARHVDKIFRGTKPADIPVEQPTKFEFAINLKTAKALGLTIPPSLLLRADQVIE